MYDYSVVHCRKNEDVMMDTLNLMSKDGWKLHTIFERNSHYLMIMERPKPTSSQPEPEEAPAVVRRRKTREEPVILVTSEDEDASSSPG